VPSLSVSSERLYHGKLHAVAEHLRCAPTETAIIERCRNQADFRCDEIDASLTPAERLVVLADAASVQFEIAHSDAELDNIAAHYASLGELGFALRRPRFDTELLAAILRRQHAATGERIFVALIDARGPKDAMAFFSRAHEVAHPVLEPQLAFDFREETTRRDQWEALVDRVGSEMVFGGKPWTDAVSRIVRSGRSLAIQQLFELKNSMASEASLTAVALAATNHAGHAALVVWAGEERSRRDPIPVLRILGSTPNVSATEAATFIHQKRRVPRSSPIAISHVSGAACEAFEDLATWVGSDGRALTSRRVWSAAYPIRGNVFAVIDFGPGGMWR